MTKEKKNLFYSPDRFKSGDLSLYKFVWIVTIELIGEVDKIEMEFNLN